MRCSLASEVVSPGTAISREPESVVACSSKRLPGGTCSCTSPYVALADSEPTQRPIRHEPHAAALRLGLDRPAEAIQQDVVALSLDARAGGDAACADRAVLDAGADGAAHLLDVHVVVAGLEPWPRP